MSNNSLHSSVAESGELAVTDKTRSRAGRLWSFAIGAPRRGTARRMAAVALGAASVTLAMGSPTPAAAAPPVVVDQGELDDTFVLPADEFICDIDVVSHLTGSFRVTEFSDRDGNLTHVSVHFEGTTHVTSDYGESVDRWALNETFDVEALTSTLTGNVYNVHSGTGGILVNDSGRVVFDLTTDEPISIQGPHEVLAGEIADLCAVLEPH